MLDRSKVEASALDGHARRIGRCVRIAEEIAVKLEVIEREIAHRANVMRGRGPRVHRVSRDLHLAGVADVVDAAGAGGHYLKQVIAGDFNSVSTQQQGSNDTTVDIRATGSHNTITVRSSSGIIANPITAIAR